MGRIDYKAKILEFSQEVEKIISQNSELSELKRLISLLHRMLYYAEQFFLELELQYRNDPQLIKKVRQDHQQVVNQLKSFADGLANYQKNLNQLLNFLKHWQSKLTLEQEYSSL